MSPLGRIAIDRHLLRDMLHLPKEMQITAITIDPERPWAYLILVADERIPSGPEGATPPLLVPVYETVQGETVQGARLLRIDGMELGRHDGGYCGVGVQDFVDDLRKAVAPLPPKPPGPPPQGRTIREGRDPR